MLLSTLMRYSKGFITPLIAIILIIAAGIGGYVFVRYRKINDKNGNHPILNPYANNATTPQSPASTSTPLTATVPADWKTYRNEKYGFEVNYPAGYGEPTVLPNGMVSIEFFLANQLTGVGISFEPDTTQYSDPGLLRFHQVQKEKYSIPKGDLKTESNKQLKINDMTAYQDLFIATGIEGDGVEISIRTSLANKNVTHFVFFVTDRVRISPKNPTSLFTPEITEDTTKDFVDAYMKMLSTFKFTK